ncbi:hypothetical protein BJ508DRAFT_175488 [Ascobolus immersus RN42]|uniref:MARVEL domain-containing protein n=1 Tax=Ascobolus immersus RN42 TaxID=1160509 RepID=A0A3N4HUS7_ASCIM|nr:hypothetical protein BJ508DRAFT_175488 [Ascobolus immersus RN42]
MIGSTIFLFLRLVQIVTLIPIWGMLAYFVHKYSDAGVTPPVEILVLFIVAIIATAWAIITLFQFKRYSLVSMLIAFIDLLMVGALIAGVYYLRGISKANCSSWNGGPVDFDRNGSSVSASYNSGWGIRVKKHCGMQKAAWALGIVNIILFFASALVAAHLYRKTERKEIRREHKATRRSGRRSRW